MLFPIKLLEDFKDLTELASLQNQVQAVRLHDELGEQNFHEVLQKVFERVTKCVR